MEADHSSHANSSTIPRCSEPPISTCSGRRKHISIYSAAVEIFKSDVSQWYRTDPLPTVCCNISLSVIGNTCYALGGYYDLHLRQALYASTDNLLGNAVLATQTTQSGSSDTHWLAWKTLPNTPTCQSAAAMLAGSLLSIEKEICMYSPSANSWIYISDLPIPWPLSAVAILSSTEILVIGGWCDGRVNTVHKGTLVYCHEFMLIVYNNYNIMVSTVCILT